MNLSGRKHLEGQYLRRLDLAVLFVAVEHARQETISANLKSPQTVAAVAGEAITLGLIFGTPSQQGSDGKLNAFLREHKWDMAKHLMVVYRSINRLCEAGLLFRINRMTGRYERKRNTYQYGITTDGLKMYYKLSGLKFSKWPEYIDYLGVPDDAFKD